MNDLVVKCVAENNLLENISNIATVVISLINLLFIIAIYFKDKKNEKSEKLKKYKYDWFKMIDVRKRVDNLNNLNMTIKQKADELYNNSEDSLEKRNDIMANTLSEINSLMFSEKNSYTYILKCIDVNENVEITKLYNDYQEEYMNVLLMAKAKEEFDISKLVDLSSKISEKFYMFGINLIK